jgi:dihydrofolate synthase/folylpolyglutamate synthase
VRTADDEINPSLENLAAVCAAVGHPERSFSVVQVAGTNGKTSTTRLIDALLRAEGLRTVRYLSPALLDDTERICIEGTALSRRVLDATIAEARSSAARLGITLTSFEEMTLACFLAARAGAVDCALLEVGLGGRWDATSVTRPAVAVITGVALDHTEILGHSVEAIAADKACIIKPGATVILGESVGATAPVFLRRAREQGDPVFVVAESGDVSAPAASATYCVSSASLGRTYFSVTTPYAHYRDLTLSAAAYQASNAATAFLAAEATLGRALNAAVARRALTPLTFPGRFEFIRKDPLLIFDGAHNPQAAAILAGLIVQLPQRPVIALGVLADKDAAGIIGALAPVAADFIALTPPVARALPAERLAELITRQTGKAPCAQLPSGVDVLAQLFEVTDTKPLLITGSLSLYQLLPDEKQRDRLCLQGRKKPG